MIIRLQGVSDPLFLYMDANLSGWQVAAGLRPAVTILFNRYRFYLYERTQRQPLDGEGSPGRLV